MILLLIFLTKIQAKVKRQAKKSYYQIKEILSNIVIIFHENYTKKINLITKIFVEASLEKWR